MTSLYRSHVANPEDFASDSLSLFQAKASNIVRQILEAIDECHSRDIAFLDLQLGNLMFENMDSDDLKLIDFGGAIEVCIMRSFEVPDDIRTLTSFRVSSQGWIHFLEVPTQNLILTQNIVVFQHFSSKIAHKFFAHAMALAKTNRAKTRISRIFLSF